MIRARGWLGVVVGGAFGLTGCGTTPSASAIDSGVAADAAPRFVLAAHTDLSEGMLALRTNLPLRPADCLALPDEGTPCADADADDLVDAWEDVFLDRFRPVLRFDEAEDLFDDPSSVMAIVGRVAPAMTGQHLRAFLTLGYSKDYGNCGLSSHNGDSERIAFDLEPLPGGGAGDVRAVQVYTAAHENTPNDHSRVFSGADLALLEYAQDAATGEPRWRVYSSENKHATYATNAICDGVSVIPCFKESCSPDGVPEASAFEKVPVVWNAGEQALPRLTDLAPVGFPGDDAWLDQSFCGGLSRSATCAGSMRSKLVDDPFVL
ncbi:MAG: hypothetical protein H6Q90_1258 [Deltaproteobacteria bacterium]|nr:hypothetical protein [Deltaproteobacteria bacterium]